MRSKSEILDLLWDQPITVAHAVGFKDMTELHNEWLRSFLYSKEDQTLLAHRGSFKTTTISVFLAIHAVIHPNQNVIFFRKTDTDTGEVIRQTIKILESDIMQYITRCLYDRDLVLIQKSGGAITTNLMTSTVGASQILGLGIGTSITGKHCHIAVTDDIVNKEDRTSRAERERTKRAYYELQNIVNRGGRFINTATPWHKEDAVSTLMPNITRYDCYSTGLMTAEQIQEKREQMPPSLFAANYELKHIADTAAMFTAPKFYKGDPKDIENGRAHIDAAYGGDDFTAYTILKRKKDGQGYIGYGKLWHGHVDNCLAEIKAIHTKYKAGSISCEKNADKGYLARDMRQKGFIVTEYSEHENKFVKIATYLKRDWNKIEWLPNTDPNYIDQILDFTENSEHDDAPDSAASLVRSFENIGRIGNKAEVLYGRR